MKTYGFDFLSKAGEVEAVDVGEFPTDTDAIERAHQSLAARLTAVAVTVWRDGARVAHIDRQPARS